MLVKGPQNKWPSFDDVIMPYPADIIDDCGIPNARYDELVCIECNLFGSRTH